MQRAAFSFATVTLLTALLAAACLFLAQKGYPFGAVGLRRLGNVANAPTFIPIAALYFLSAALMMLLPLRAAAFVLTNAADVLFWTAIALLGAIIGVVLGQVAFGQTRAPAALFDWRFAYAAAIFICHFLLNSLRANLLLRTLGFAVFVAACAFCLFW